LPDDSSFRSAISAFGAAAKFKLSNPAISGAREDQLRAPLEALTGDLAAILGLPGGAISMVGESTVSALKTRPD